MSIGNGEKGLPHNSDSSTRNRKAWLSIHPCCQNNDGMCDWLWKATPRNLYSNCLHRCTWPGYALFTGNFLCFPASCKAFHNSCLTFVIKYYWINLVSKCRTNCVNYGWTQPIEHFLNCFIRGDILFEYWH